MGIATPQQDITVLGLGAMGSALALAFRKAGLETHVWNRTVDRPGVKAVLADGGQLKDTAASALEASSLIIVCLYDYESIYSVLSTASKEEFASKTIVNLTNGTPSEARAMSSWMREREVLQYFDGAIMNTPQHVGTPHAFVLISGEDEQAFDTISTTLRSIGRLDFLGSEPGAAALYDSVLLAGMYGMFGGTLTAIALLSKASSPREKGTPAVSTAAVIAEKLIPMLQALLPSLVETAEYFDAKDWRGHPANNSVQEGGLRNILATCEDEGVDAGLLRYHHEMFGEALKDGRGEEGMAGLVRDLVGE
ncbi:hypothetical protein M409DRAFT_60517 [Zasmidium cellare ATCC 36951]|uniref:Uncharacterized protein n=1 Tax=Zasmidium cellare ATCC 36951 TaxID=1080233 RepID=A0A6A6C0Q5_ZASCE|nr:uncharacterized protein M409DRAFT_60517 [Zasmidium cellare ATCC 36951]KAF2159740.1 hypothetical protein M409DRAFT_60517 [Zasmidium cellare ATCC 36951]